MIRDAVPLLNERSMFVDSALKIRLDVAQVTGFA